MQFTVVQGDIAEQRADALVNAAGTSLRMGSGVAGALRRAAGSELNDAAMAKGPVELGEVAVTDAFDLDAGYVIHAAAMPHYGVHENASSREHAGPEGSGNDGEATTESIRSATRNALAAADERGCQTTSDGLSELRSDNGCESVVIPALGCGVAGFDLAEGARIIADEIRSFDPEHLEDVRFVAYGDEDHETVRDAVA